MGKKKMKTYANDKEYVIVYSRREDATSVDEPNVKEALKTALDLFKEWYPKDKITKKDLFVERERRIKLKELM